MTQKSTLDSTLRKTNLIVSRKFMLVYVPPDFFLKGILVNKIFEYSIAIFFYQIKPHHSKFLE